MGGGRRTQVIVPQKKPPPKWTTNCSISAKNLRKNSLGGVIFGCKHATYKECIAKQLFGLPAPHYSYVKNVTPGMPLFLFNYSDRTLHGIFEAVTYGQMNINQYAWTSDGSKPTTYAAQVRVKIRMHCQPLKEDQFKPVIAENYNEYNHFWFELDKAQTHNLITLFSSLPISQNTSISRSMANWGTLFEKSVTQVASQSQGGPNTKLIGDEQGKGRSEVRVNRDSSGEHRDLSMALQDRKWSSLFTSGDSKKEEHVHGSIGFQEKAWSSLLKPLPDSGAMKKEA